MKTSNLFEALRYHAEHPESRLAVYDEYGNRLHFAVAGGELVYEGTPFDDLNGAPVQGQDLVNLAKELAGGGWIDVTHREAPTQNFPFFEEI